MFSNTILQSLRLHLSVATVLCLVPKRSWDECLVHLMFSYLRDFIPSLFSSLGNIDQIYLNPGLSMFIEGKFQDFFVPEVEILNLLLYLMKNILKENMTRLSFSSWPNTESGPMKHVSYS